MSAYNEFVVNNTLHMLSCLLDTLAYFGHRSEIDSVHSPDFKTWYSVIVIPGTVADKDEDDVCLQDKFDWAGDYPMPDILHLDKFVWEKRECRTCVCWQGPHPHDDPRGTCGGDVPDEMAGARTPASFGCNAWKQKAVTA